MLWITSGIENPSKSEVVGRCGGDEKNEWRRTDKSRTLKKEKRTLDVHRHRTQIVSDYHDNINQT